MVLFTVHGYAASRPSARDDPLRVRVQTGHHHVDQGIRGDLPFFGGGTFGVMPISVLRRAPNWPWSKTKTVPKIAELNVGISIKPTLNSLQPPRPITTDNDRPDGTTRHWQWSCPDGHPPTQPSLCTLRHPDFISITYPLQRQRTTK